MCCRPKDGSVEKMKSAIKSFAGLFKMEVKLSILKPLTEHKHYDVFISYSHRNTAKAKEFLDAMQQMNPELDIFFDKSELRTGRHLHQIITYKFCLNMQWACGSYTVEYTKWMVCNNVFPHEVKMI